VRRRLESNAKRGTIRTAGGRVEEQMRGLKAMLDQTGKGQIWVRGEEGTRLTLNGPSLGKIHGGGISMRKIFGSHASSV